jgi:hypothetical protein
MNAAVDSVSPQSTMADVLAAHPGAAKCFRLADLHAQGYSPGMKAITIREAQAQLGELVAEACRGEVIVLTDGDKQVTLYPGKLLDLEEDSPELERELLKAASGPFTRYSSEEMREACDKIIREKRE